MSHTTLPSVKGQITIPAEIREKYRISKKTPLVIEDKGEGVILMRVMSMAPYDAIQHYETKKERGLNFPHGVDPKVLLDFIKEIDG